MLHKSNSNATHYVKYVFIIPLLALFLMSFNTKTVYYSNSTADNLSLIEDGEITGIISKDDNDDQLDALVSTFASQNVVLKIKNVKRNTNNEIIKISIEAKSKTSTLKYNKDSDDPISSIKIYYNNSTDTLQLNEAGEVSEIIFTESGNATIVKTNNPNSFFMQTDKDPNTFVVKKITTKNKDQSSSVFIVADKDDINLESDNKEINWISADEKTIIIDNSDDQKLNLKHTISESPLILINGKKATKEEMDKLDPDMIKEVTVLKSEQATEKYGEEAKDGVIKITLKD